MTQVNRYFTTVHGETERPHKVTRIRNIMSLRNAEKHAFDTSKIDCGTALQAGYSGTWVNKLHLVKMRQREPLLEQEGKGTLTLLYPHLLAPN